MKLLHPCAALLPLLIAAANLPVNGSVFLLNVTTYSCSEVGTIPAVEQCQFVRTHCNGAEYQIGILDYLRVYYCSPIKIFPIALVAVGAILCFASLALTASDFLCPNLYAISKFLDLSDNLTGLTLLALGNGSADVVSTFKALKVGSAGLAVSELVGAALFILTMVVGSISIVRPFRVPRYHFLRDTSFYITISLLITGTLCMGRLTFIGSIVLLSTYIIYVLVAIYTHLWLRESAKKQISEARIRGNYDDDGQPPDLDELHQHYPDSLSILPLIDELGNFDEEDLERFNEFDSFLSSHPRRPSEERVPIQTGSYGLKVLLKELSKHSMHNIKPLSRVSLVNERPLSAPTPDMFSTPAEPVVSSSSSENLPVQQEPRKNDRFMLLRSLLPDWDLDASWVALFYYIICAPASILLKLSTPVREKAINYVEYSITSSNAFTFEAGAEDAEDPFENYLYIDDLKLFRLQFVVAPAFIEVVYFSDLKYFWLVFPSTIVLFSLLAMALPISEPNISASTSIHRFINYLGSFIGFVLSLLWISIFATEIVAILKATAVVFAISDDILGSTVFALGNSVGDLVSNITIAKMGMPVMAFGACFGGPLLSLCSLGLTSIIVMSSQHEKYIPISFSPTLKLNCCALVMTLVFIALWIPRNNWMFDRKVGSVLISAWVLSVLVSIIMEIK